MPRAACATTQAAPKSPSISSTVIATLSVWQASFIAAEAAARPGGRRECWPALCRRMGPQQRRDRHHVRQLRRWRLNRPTTTTCQEDARRSSNDAGSSAASSSGAGSAAADRLRCRSIDSTGTKSLILATTEQPRGWDEGADAAVANRRPLRTATAATEAAEEQRRSWPRQRRGGRGSGGGGGGGSAAAGWQQRQRGQQRRARCAQRPAAAAGPSRTLKTARVSSR